MGNFCDTESMSGVNIGGQVTFILTNAVIGLFMGATVLIGQYVGAGNRLGLTRVTATIITVLLALGLALSFILSGRWKHNAVKHSGAFSGEPESEGAP